MTSRTCFTPDVPTYYSLGTNIGNTAGQIINIIQELGYNVYDLISRDKDSFLENIYNELNLKNPIITLDEGRLHWITLVSQSKNRIKYCDSERFGSKTVLKSKLEEKLLNDSKINYKIAFGDLMSYYPYRALIITK